jgi:hypothetical protein
VSGPVSITYFAGMAATIDPHDAGAFGMLTAAGNAALRALVDEVLDAVSAGTLRGDDDVRCRVHAGLADLDAIGHHEVNDATVRNRLAAALLPLEAAGIDVAVVLD